MVKKINLVDKNNSQKEYEIDINDVLSFESEFDNNFMLYSKDKKVNGLIFVGSIFELYQKLKSESENIIIDYITQSVQFDNSNEVITASIMKEIVYNVKNAIISIEYFSENKYDVRISFKDKDGSLIVEYESYWKSSEVFWYEHFIKDLKEKDKEKL